MKPLCTNSQRPWRNGWQFVCCTGDPIAARMCARKSGDSTCAASRAGSRPPRPATRCGRRRPSPVPYQPRPKPSPLVGSAPMRAWRLWSTIPCSVLKTSSSTRTGCPTHAIHRHMAGLSRHRRPQSMGRACRRPSCTHACVTQAGQLAETPGAGCRSRRRGEQPRARATDPRAPPGRRRPHPGRTACRRGAAARRPPRPPTWRAGRGGPRSSRRRRRRPRRCARRAVSRRRPARPGSPRRHALVAPADQPRDARERRRRVEPARR